MTKKSSDRQAFEDYVKKRVKQLGEEKYPDKKIRRKACNLLKSFLLKTDWFPWQAALEWERNK